jgi:hypothetical protein
MACAADKVVPCLHPLAGIQSKPLGHVCRYSRSANTQKRETCAKGFLFGETMAKTIDITGLRFGRLIASEYVKSDNGAIWAYKCDCGNSVIQRTTHIQRKLKRGSPVSCGCVTAYTKVFDDGIKCFGCLTNKPPSHFNKSKNGYQPRCKECQKQWRAENAAYLKQAKAEYHQKHRENLNKAARERQAKNKEQSNARSKRWRDANPDRRKEIANAWAKRNPESAVQHQRLRTAKAKQAQPIWARKDCMKAIYVEARRRRNSGEKCHVDHIVPLLSPIVSGLHCEANLQIISAFDNQSKSNRHWPDMP